MANKVESSPEEIKTYLMRKNQYQQYTSLQTTIQPFNAVTSNNTTTNIKPATTTAQSERKRFEGQCFYCGKTGHPKAECRAKQRDEANGIKKEDAIPMKKPADPEKPKYNPKLVCQICGYTSHSARDCRRLQSPKRKKKAVPHMAKYHTQQTPKKITKIEDKTLEDNNGLSIKSKPQQKKKNKITTLTKTSIRVFETATISTR